jgi:hypothetical protein
VVPEFTRLQWASQEAEDVWKPRFSKICKVQNDTEVSTVLNHDRRVGMPSLSMYQFNKLKLPKGFVAKIQDVHCAPKYFGTLVQEFQEGKPFSIRTVIGRESDVDNFIELYRQGEQANCGELLGYPQCCCDFFMKTWVGDNIRGRG